MWDGFNKRKFPRVNINCEVTIKPDSESAPLKAVTENLGLGGICVLLDHSVERFSKCRVKLDLDEKFPKIECEGKAIWSVPTQDVKSKKRFDIGIEFMGLEPEQQERIRVFLENHAR